MSLTNDGFVHVSVTDRIGEIAARLKEYIPEVDLSEGEWLYQVVKVAAVREDAIQQEHQRIVDNLSLPLSYGEYLEMQAANMGVYKKTGSRASGIVIGYGPGDGAATAGHRADGAISRSTHGVGARAGFHAGTIRATPRRGARRGI